MTFSCKLLEADHVCKRHSCFKITRSSFAFKRPGSYVEDTFLLPFGLSMEIRRKIEVGGGCTFFESIPQGPTESN